MVHTYHITGTTCSSCEAKVRSALLGIGEITGVQFDREKEQAEVTMRSHVPVSKMQEALKETKYTISETGDQVMRADQPAAVKTYLPVFLIFGMITSATLMIQLANGSFSLQQWMAHFMAGFFLSFSFFKLLDVPAFAGSYGTYDIIASRFPAYGYVYPFIELALGLALLVPAWHHPVNLAALIIMSVSSIGVIRSLAQKRPFQCACLGAVFNLPLSKISLIEDLLMVAMSAIMLIL